MSKLLKRLALGFMLLIAIVLASFMIGFMSTNGEYNIPETVDTDSLIPSIELNSIKFHSETFGNPENPTLIVLHGGPGSDYRYLLDLQVLADQYFVVFYDQRGSGLSTRIGSENLTVQDMIDDLDLFIEHYSPNQPIYLIGHSWGAMLASGYVGQYPEKVAKLVLAEPGGLTNDTMAQFMDNSSSLMGADFMLSVAPVWFESLHITDSEERADYFAGRTASLWEAHVDNPYHCPEESKTYPSWRSGSTVSNAILGNARQSDGTLDVSLLSENASRFALPILFLASECNTWLGEDLQREHAMLFPSAQVVVIEDAGHYMFNDNLEASLTTIRAYFNSL
jgi:proline iminopeptidase